MTYGRYMRKIQLQQSVARAVTTNFPWILRKKESRQHLGKTSGTEGSPLHPKGQDLRTKRTEMVKRGTIHVFFLLAFFYADVTLAASWFLNIFLQML